MDKLDTELEYNEALEGETLSNEAIEEELARKEIEYAERLAALGQRLQGLATDTVARRQPIEDRMLEDLRQYHSKYDAQTDANLKSRKNRSSVFVNITRAKTTMAEARVADMLFPSDDKNWGIQPTPVPDMDLKQKDPTPITDPATGQMIDKGDGTPATKGDFAKEQFDAAIQASKSMEYEIDDQLVESHYTAKSREAIHYSAMLGTGIIKAPVVVNRSRKKWSVTKDGDATIGILDMDTKHRPDIEVISPFDFFPDLSAKRIEDCEFVFERKYVTKKQLREMIGRKGFLSAAIKQVLKETPSTFAIGSSYLQSLRDITGVSSFSDSSRYEYWEYHGPVSKEDLEACGVDVEDDFEEFEGCVSFIGNHIIKTILNPMETYERPYHVFAWEEDESTLFGYGVPYLMRTAQRVVNSSWRAMMDNAGLSVGPQIVVNRDLIEPADGKWEVSAMKLWFLTDRTRNVQEAFHAAEINSHQAELLNIIQSAMNFSDIETSLPVIAQGDQGNVPVNTATSMSMLMSAANTVLRRIIKRWDDYITKPLITQFYDWNMQFNEKPEIKGDYQVDARGTSALMTKELQSQQIMQLFPMLGNQEIAMLVNTPELFKMWVEAMRLPVKRIVRSDSEVEQAKQSMGQQVDPVIQKAQMETEMIKYRVDSEKEMHDARIARLRESDAIDLQMKQADREIQMMELANVRNISLDKIKSQLAQTSTRERTRKEIFAAEAQIKAQMGTGI